MMELIGVTYNDLGFHSGEIAVPLHEAASSRTET